MTKYKLYREFGELFNPSISRQNISNYKIIFKNNLIPVDVYYPNKDVPLNRIMLYITTKDQSICRDLAILTKQMVLVLTVSDDNISKGYELIKYIYDHVEDYNLSKEDITTISDYKALNIWEEITMKARKNNDFYMNKTIFLNFNGNVKIDNNKLYIPDIKSPYTFYTKNQLFEIINRFLA